MIFYLLDSFWEKISINNELFHFDFNQQEKEITWNFDKKKWEIIHNNVGIKDTHGATSPDHNKVQ